MTQSRIDYILSTGEADRQRLTILNSLYNPATHTFLQNAGLKKGMKVLEIGCGTGHMASWMAEIVGPSGHVMAIDNNSAQLKIAAEIAEHACLSNISFAQIDVRDVMQIDQTFDFIYGRWVLEFVENPDQLFKSLFQLLNSGGILTYETTSLVEDSFFSFPRTELPTRWLNLVKSVFTKIGTLDFNFVVRCHDLLQQLGCVDIDVKSSQPIALTAETKSVFRLGLLSFQDMIFQHDILSKQDFQKLLAEYSAMEQTNGLVSFVRNLLFKGVKR